MDPVEKARELLPFFAVYGTAILYPLLAVAASALVLAIAYRLARPPRDSDVHWTERARHYWAGWQLLRSAALTCFVVLGFGSVFVTGPVSPAGPIDLLAAVGVGIYVLVRLGTRRHQRRYLEWLDRRTARRGHWGVFFILRLALASTILTGILLPADPGLLFFAVLVPGLSLFFFGAAGGGVHIARRLGLARPAPEGIASAVAVASQERGREPPHCYVADLAMANAYALPLIDTVVFSGRAAAVLDPEEIRALAAHEVAHLAEPGRVTAQRLLGLPFCLVLMGTRPLLANAGPFEYLLSLAVGWLLLMRTIRFGRRLETDADTHAHAHGHGHADDGDREDLIYARALERMYRENLTPAVVGRALSTHPELYDRLEAVGAAPGYPRPKPPPRRRGTRLAITLPAVAILLVVGALTSSMRSHEPGSESDAIRAIAFTGGSPDLLAELGSLRLDTDDPATAATFYRAAEALEPEWPLYPAGLARALARIGDEDGAQAALCRAEEILAGHEPYSVEVREEVMDARTEILVRFANAPR